MHLQEINHCPTERHADTQTATLFVPFRAALELLRLCARCDAQILSVQPLAKVYGGFSVEVTCSNHIGYDLLAEWLDVTKVLEEDRTS
jgi:hypothetical protein